MLNVSEILALWSKLTGFDPEAKAWSYGDWDIRKMSEGVRRAQELDESDALALMLMEAFLDSFLANRTFRASEMLADLDKHFTFLEEAQEMRRLLATSGMPEAREELKGWVLQALSHYGAAHRKDVKDILSSRDRVAFLWRDALEAMDKTLETHQFMQGDPDAAVPRYHDHVLSTWTANGLLQSMVNMPSGIVLAMIRDAEAIHSYFVFGIRNGGTLTLLTDRTGWAHPFAKRMTRKPDKAMNSRAQRSWFPYSVLDVRSVVDEDGDVESYYVKREEGIVPSEQVARKVRPINELEPEEVVWTAMMFNLIAKKFFVAGHRTAALSYLGEQVRVSAGMEVAAFARNLPVTAYEPLSVEPLKSSDLTRERVAKDAGISEHSMRADGSGENAWMEERYRHLVDDARLNLIGPPGTNVLQIALQGHEAPLPAEKPFFTERAEKRWDLESFDASSFHDKDRLLADRVFVGRYNQAKEIDRHAALEYEARRDEIRAWWLAAVVANKPALLAAIGAGELIGRAAVKRDGGRHRSGDLDTSVEGMRGNILRFTHRADAGDYLYAFQHKGLVLGDEDASMTAWIGTPLNGKLNPCTYCPVTGVKTVWRARFTPRDPGDLALLAGVAVDALPDVLAHWTDRSHGTGNAILDRVDPMDWVAENPWRAIDFNVEAWMSQSGFKKLAKAAGGPDVERYRDKTDR